MIHFADTITQLGAEARGAVIVSGSHGGVYPACLAAQAHPAGVILNDAGVGKDRAGIASLDYLQALGIAAAMLANTSCRIGSTGDMRERGIVSHANPAAVACGVREGMSCLEAARLLQAARPSTQPVPAVAEARQLRADGPGRALVLIDSASLVEAEDAGRIVITGSHGGLIGGVPAKALAVDAFAAVFHDAGLGIDGAGITRLPALDARGIATLTAAGDSARIGDARSVLEEGRVSHANRAALHLGVRIGERIAEVAARWRLA